MNNNDFVAKLAEAIKLYGDNNAFCIDGKYYTYKDLGEKTAAIRHRLNNTSEKYIGLVANDDIETYASILAIWMDGKCYVPLHPLQPMARCLDIISQVGIMIILDSSSVSRYADANVIETAKIVSEGEMGGMDIVHNDNQMAYILFTSGSTGRPKGVPISINNVSAFVRAFLKTGISLSTDDRCLQMFDLTFDLSVGSYLPPLFCGACVYTVKPGRVKWQEAFRLIDEYHITEALMVPSVIHYLRPYLDEMDAPQMRYSLFCGEALSADDTEQWRQALPGAEIWNVYGPTENTIYCTLYRVSDSDIKQQNNIVSIGKAMSGTETMIIDENGNRLTAEEKGELCLAGEQLTDGYWHNSDKTTEAFFEVSGKRWYRTGDICAEDRAGDIIYYGRKDSQVKIQGYRIELSEIESIARKFYNGDIAVVAVPAEDTNGNMSIQLAIEDEDKEKDEKLLEYMRGYLPSYMIPSKVYHLSRFPQNANNKIDRKEIKNLIK